MSKRMNTSECPHCGSRNIEDNGEPRNSPELTCRCENCNEQWEPNAD